MYVIAVAITQNAAHITSIIVVRISIGGNKHSPTVMFPAIRKWW